MSSLEADQELDEITAPLRGHPDVLELRWQICAKVKKWEACVDLARAITELVPSSPDGWIHLAYALRRAKDGGLRTAWEALRPVADKFPKVWTIPYNLACYCAQLGRLEECEQWLKKAVAIDEGTVKRLAIEDPDLKPLWEKMGGTMWRRTE
jgi:predicted Zn-dependent protease